VLKWLLVIILTGSLAAPALAGKNKSGGGKSGKCDFGACVKTKSKTVSLILDLASGACRTRDGSEADIGMKLLGTYDTRENAEKAQATFSECNAGSATKIDTRKLQEDEADCRKQAKSANSSTLKGLLIGLTEGSATDTYWRCMKAYGYQPKE
jgi:hypothetical protein